VVKSLRPDQTIRLVALDVSSVVSVLSVSRINEGSFMTDGEKTVVSVEDRKTIDYALPQTGRELPTWAHFVAIVFWVLVYLLVYGMAVGGPLLAVAGVYLVVHRSPHVQAFGEPVETVWQRVRMVAYPIVVSAVFVPLAIWLHKQKRR
jgi:hypothetical protein